MNFYQEVGLKGYDGTRRQFMVEAVKGRIAVHIGCTDEGLTAERMKSGGLLHSLLVRSAVRVVGVDVDTAGLLEMIEAGYTVYNHDFTDGCPKARLEKEIQSADVVLVPEVVEHLGCPEEFLGNVFDTMWGLSRIVVSAPNAFSAVHIRETLERRKEFVHPDHVSWYSPFTLGNLLRRVGFVVENTWTCGFEVQKDPWLRETVIIEARKP